MKRVLGVFLLSLFVQGIASNVWADPLRIGLVLDKGGKDDKSFNSAALRGANLAKDEFQAYVKYVEAGDDNSYETLLRSLAQKDFNIIIAVGLSQADALRKVAPLFPKKHFAIVDAVVKAPNVRSLMFQEQEGSFLVGAIAALTSKSGKVGFIGGMDIPLIRRFELGFKAGAQKANPKVILTSNFVGVTSDAWNNPAKAKELSLAQFHSGVDVIFAAAGASNGGLFDAAEETKKFAIGVDSNQNGIKPGLVLTSMLKRVDTAVQMTCKDEAVGKFTSGEVRYGLSNSGVDYAVDANNEKILTPDVRSKVNQLKAEIIAGKIKVPDYYLNQK